MSQEKKQRIYFGCEVEWDQGCDRGSSKVSVRNHVRKFGARVRRHSRRRRFGQWHSEGTSKTVEDILIERGSKPISERKAFSGVGPYSEAKGAWEPRTNPDTGLSGGTPWRQHGDPRFRGAK